MERRTVLGRLNWQFGEVWSGDAGGNGSDEEHPAFCPPNWMGHRPGQHVDVRLTAI